MNDTFELTWAELGVTFFGCATLVALLFTYWFGV